MGACLALYAVACSSTTRPKEEPTIGPGNEDAGAAGADASRTEDAALVGVSGADAASAPDAEPSFVATALAMGAHHTCALTAPGGIRCWGDNTFGQLGDGTTTARLTSVGVIGFASGVVAIAAGDDHTCALTGAGSVACWGDNAAGALGMGSVAEAQANTPSQVAGLTSGVTAIAAGGADTCAAVGDGGIVCWGDNVSGQLGDGTNTERDAPTPTEGADGVLPGSATMAPAGDHTCFVTSGGSVVCAGDDTNGELGNGENASTNSYVASGISNGATAVAASLGVTCALIADGTVQCWGFGGQGELGNGSMDPTNGPGAVPGLANVGAIVAGAGHACAVTGDAGVLCWGDNSGGAIGDGTTAARATPTPVSGLGDATAVSAGSGSCAITSAGSVFCWGPNTAGEVGDGTTAERDAPVPVTGFP